MWQEIITFSIVVYVLIHIIIKVKNFFSKSDKDKGSVCSGCHGCS